MTSVLSVAYLPMTRSCDGRHAEDSPPDAILAFMNHDFMLITVVLCAGLCYIVLRRILSQRGPQYACARCHSTFVSPTSKMRGSLGLELFLYLLLILPGLIYSLIRHFSKRAGCPACGSEEFLPLATPRGRELAAAKGASVGA